MTDRSDRGPVAGGSREGSLDLACRSVLDDARGLVAGQPIAALQEGQFDQEVQADDLPLQALDQLDRAANRAAGGQQVVTMSTRAGRFASLWISKCWEPYSERIRPNRQEAAELPHRHQTGPQLVSDRPLKIKPRGLCPRRSTRCPGAHHQVNRIAVGVSILSSVVMS
jgi:hypothetical protein